MRESEFTTKLLSALRRHPVLASSVIWKLNDRTTAGIPDFLVVFNGRTTFWEVKVLPRQLTKLQAYFINRLNAGAWRIAFVVRVQESYHWIEDRPLEFAELVEEIVVRCVNA